MGHAIRDRIAMELMRLGAQKRQYLVAIAVAESSATLRKHIRTVQRLDDEIAARKEVLRGLPATDFVPYAEVEPELAEIELLSQEIVLVAEDISQTTIYMGTGT